MNFNLFNFSQKTTAMILSDYNMSHQEIKSDFSYKTIPCVSCSAVFNANIKIPVLKLSKL